MVVIIFVVIYVYLYCFRAAFFKGQIEHPGSTRFRFRTINDDPVYIAVNTEGVSVIDMDDVVCNFIYSAVEIPSTSKW